MLNKVIDVWKQLHIVTYVIFLGHGAIDENGDNVGLIPVYDKKN